MKQFVERHRAAIAIVAIVIGVTGFLLLAAVGGRRGAVPLPLGLVFGAMWLLGMGGMAYMSLRVLPGELIGRAATPAQAIERAANIQHSGPIVASDSVAGLVGGLWFTAAGLDVSVYPAGIVIRARWTPITHAIFASEIRGYGYKKRRWRGPFQTIEHSGVDSISPVVLMTPEEGYLGNAIKLMAEASMAMTRRGAWTSFDQVPAAPEALG